VDIFICTDCNVGVLLSWNSSFGGMMYREKDHSHTWRVRLSWCDTGGLWWEEKECSTCGLRKRVRIGR